MYLAEYPNGHYTIDAKAFIKNEKTKARKAKKQKELNAWYNVKDSTYALDFKRFLKKYPNSSHARLARLKAKKYKANTRAPEGFVHIKAGSFQMGSSSGDKDEKPVHRVNIDYDFYIGKYEVTVGEFRKFIDATNHSVETNTNGGCFIYDGKWKKESNANWDNPYFSQSENAPVVCVSHNDAKAYTNWLSQKSGKTYRLPTEAEWEYVARAGTTTKYSFGDSKNNLSSYGWYKDNSNNKTYEVGQKQPNPWGVYDMHGNVWEWCEDRYTDSYSNTPRNGKDNNSGSQKKRVLRGGSWNSNAGVLRSANRIGNFPDGSSVNYGFRVVFLP